MNYLKLLLAFGVSSTLPLAAKHDPALAPHYIRTYVGAAGGFGRLLIHEQLTNPNSYSANEGECSVKQRVWAMSSQFATGTPEAGRFGLSAFFRLDIGGAPSKWYWQRAVNPPAPPAEQKDFNLFLYMRMGIGFARSFNDHMMIGIRYYNSYNADAMRATYSNADDAASLGVYGCYDRLSFNIGYSDDNIPGILVNSSAWSFMQADLRYHMGNWDEDRLGWYIGLDYEKSFLQGTALENNGTNVGTQSGSVNFVMFSVGICGPR